MNKLLIAFAAAALAFATAPTAQAGFNLRLGGASSLVHTAGCDEDCAEYLEERAEERDYQREEAAEHAEDEGYGLRRRGMARQRQVMPAGRESPGRAAKSSSKSGDDEDVAEPKKTDSEKAVAAAPPGGCRQYFPAVGMTLSVPCE